MTTASSTIEIHLPDLGESVTEGTIVEWRVAVGDAVGAGDVLLDVTTDKVDVEIPAPAAGVLVAISANPGDAVEVGSLLGAIDPDGVAGGAPPPAASDANGAAAPASEPAGEPVAIVLPDMESVTEGTVIEWRVAVGAPVAADDIVVEVSTDKVDLEVPAPVGGVLSAIAIPAGETFEVTQALGEITPGAGAATADPGPVETPAAAAAPAASPAPARPAAGVPDWPQIAPLARRDAHAHGIDLSKIAGTGPGGMIRRGDLDGAAGAAPEPVAPPVSGERAVPLRGPAGALAAYMNDSRAIPTATSVRTLNVGALDGQRRAINADLKAAGRPEKLSFTHLIAWALVQAVGDHPNMGTGYAEIDGQPQRMERDAVNLGLAVDVERRDGSRSLLVPVVRDAGAMDFPAFHAAFDDLVGRTRGGGITPDELRGATVSLTNPGGLGTIASVPRLMPGQGTILATGSIAYPPGFDRANPDALRSLGVDKVMTITSTYDHRVIQGAESGAFLARIDALLSGADDFYETVRASLGLDARPAILTADPVAAIAPAPPAETAAAAPAPAAAPLAAVAAGEIDLDLLDGVSAAMSLVKAHRTHGHLAARLDPLGAEPVGDPALEPSNLGFTPERMARIPSEILRVSVPGASFLEVLPHLRSTYCGTIAYEIEHIADHEERMWLRSAIEAGRYRAPLHTVRRLELLERLVQVDSFERFLRRTYLGQKTFSIEGIDALVPMIDEIVEICAEDGSAHIMVGMAHRGRLAMMAHTVGRAPETILAEFEGQMEFEDDDEDVGVRETAGDVKYHLGAAGAYVTRAGAEVAVTLAANPSHLEQVNAVVEGETRARQTSRHEREVRHDTGVAVPVVIHGDAAFGGQGVVAETLNLSNLAGYTTGGTVHIIANNQIGFTTDPRESRSTVHASDLAKGFDFPIIHVNADDVDACMSAVRLAMAYRQRYRRDVVIDLVGYRRFGHNELDEPAYTQPVMARTIKGHQPVNKIYAATLIKEGALTQARYDEVLEWAEKRMANAHANVKRQIAQGPADENGNGAVRALPRHAHPETAVAADVLTALNEQLLIVPDGFAIHPKLAPQLERRRAALEEGEPAIVWAHAEALAFASLLTEGVPIRLTGQDSARGTFSQRHLRLHDMAEADRWAPGAGRTYTPMSNLPGATASFELHNTPLSEAAAVGFEYGYSAQAPEALVLWEAQYGDFANGAQIMVDQFIVSGQAKWGQRSRLTLLLPHGYEGNGPEHSSARIERYLQLAGEDNVRIANPSTAAQYFHLLRSQALTTALRPLVVFTPKSLLRQRGAAATLAELTGGGFATVLDDPVVSDRAGVTRLLLCSGKVFHELAAHPGRAGRGDVAIGRIELLYPFPQESLAELIGSYPSLTEVVWVQEEPRNMGAWSFLARRIGEALPATATLRYAGRERRASPSEGYPQAHQTEQQRLLADALGTHSEEL